MVKTEDLSESTTFDVVQRTSVELIRFDKNHKLCYDGYCKLQINTLSKVVNVYPVNENFNDITALFKWKFARQKDILFVFGEFDFEDFALIFGDVKTCKKVYTGIFKKRSKEYVSPKLLQKRFFSFFFEGIVKNQFSSRLKEIIEEWFETNDGKENYEYLKILNRFRDGNLEIVGEVKQEIKKEHQRIQKRKFHEIKNSSIGNGNGFTDSEQNQDLYKVPSNRHKVAITLKEDTIMIEQSHFKIVSVKIPDMLRRKLIIFKSSDQKECYEFNFRNNYFSHQCNGKNTIKAILDVHEDGSEYVRVENISHKCTAAKYDPKTYMELKVVKRPGYEIIENVASQSKRLLIIFNDPNDRSQCYEYYWSSFYRQFICCGCTKNKQLSQAEIYHENSENEYIRLINDQHICETRKYDPSKHHKCFEFVISPDFEIQTAFKNGIKRDKLVLFNKSDRNLCYTYYYDCSSKLFYCNGCSKFKNVTAKLSQNSDGEVYVILLNTKHVHGTVKFFLTRKNLIPDTRTHINFYIDNLNG